MEEKILEMLKMQDALNKAIMREHKLMALPFWKLRMALLDELGELTHELKGNWCWWKKTQKGVDPTKVLEELVDVWHFAMTIHIYFNGIEINKLKMECYLDLEIIDLPKVIEGVILCDCDILYKLNNLTKYLNFTMDDIYNAYIAKNKVNYERLNSGY